MKEINNFPVIIMDNIFDLVDLGNNAKLVIKKMFESKFPDTCYIYDKKNNNLFIKRHKLELDILISENPLYLHEIDSLDYLKSKRTFLSHETVIYKNPINNHTEIYQYDEEWILGFIL